ncbi:hypothetical protein POM88_037188 [Heracleum sosnowskyi]|uniref:Uncharacterized protein n=1 Tax=Heracleum sosnowskyi TaxID=360622 RepID=A0AAD8HQP3_9APIA|nr:hypothetical protein POM88_037188 [Heracleum sosnowskyi]
MSISSYPPLSLCDLPDQQPRPLKLFSTKCQRESLPEELRLSPEAYLIVSDRGNVCLAYLMSNVSMQDKPVTHGMPQTSKTHEKVLWSSDVVEELPAPHQRSRSAENRDRMSAPKSSQRLTTNGGFVVAVAM